ncbi:hypothetical protein FB45DRAFT_873971 [Roridomyces roridus]|uniref:Uncharacterized protein n=1 Tax=Roridomyces roridus TaxID=1738132 RepID=A0AAD7B9E6_9AGAR|nr:hypothetical protein FB45DRAFT_873971 [Roridomyces roridus]
MVASAAVPVPGTVVLRSLPNFGRHIVICITIAEVEFLLTSELGLDLEYPILFRHPGKNNFSQRVTTFPSPTRNRTGSRDFTTATSSLLTTELSSKLKNLPYVDHLGPSFSRLLSATLPTLNCGAHGHSLNISWLLPASVQRRRSSTTRTVTPDADPPVPNRARPCRTTHGHSDRSGCNAIGIVRHSGKAVAISSGPLNIDVDIERVTRLLRLDRRAAAAVAQIRISNNAWPWPVPGSGGALGTAMLVLVLPWYHKEIPTSMVLPGLCFNQAFPSSTRMSDAAPRPTRKSAKQGESRRSDKFLTIQDSREVGRPLRNEIPIWMKFVRQGLP